MWEEQDFWLRKEGYTTEPPLGEWKADEVSTAAGVLDEGKRESQRAWEGLMGAG